MAKMQNHFTMSVVLSGGYALLGASGFKIPLDSVLLATVLFIIGGALPNVDEGNGTPAREFGGVVAAVTPIVVLSLFPSLRNNGVSQAALIVVLTYALARIFISRALQHYTVHRGVFHSLPAAIITFEVFYLLLAGLPFLERVFVSFGGFAGFLTHLLMDAYGNLDLVGRAMGKGERKPSVLKLGGKTWGSTFAVYCCLLFLGWFVVRDFYPNLRFFAGVKY